MAGDDDQDLLATPEPQDPAAIGAFFEGERGGPSERSMRETVRGAAHLALFSRGQAKELMMRAIRPVAERRFASECDRHLYIHYIYERLDQWLNEPLPIEN